MQKYNRLLLSPPIALVENGQFNLGCYNSAVSQVNMLDADFVYKVNLPKFMLNVQLREWQAFQMGNERFFMMVAIYNAKKMALVQFIFYDIDKKKKYKYEKQILPWMLFVPSGLKNTKSSHHSRNFNLEAHNDLDNGKIEIKVDIKNFKDLPNVKGSFVGYHDEEKVNPCVVCMPFDENRAMYSHKCLMPMSGDLKIDEKEYQFKKLKSHMIVDDHKGFYPYVTKYDWVTAAGHLKDGALYGFNFTDNQVVNQELYNENVLWIGEEIHTLPPVKVERPNGVNKSWYIRDQYGMVDLTFVPETNTKVNANYILIESRYHGPYGFFYGSIEMENGERLEINELFGMGEKFYLRC